MAARLLAAASILFDKNRRGEMTTAESPAWGDSGGISGVGGSYGGKDWCAAHEVVVTLRILWVHIVRP